MIKNMNSKMTTNSQLSTIESKKKNKNKFSKLLNSNRITEMEITRMVISGKGTGGDWGKSYR